jgi:hypothetical protein
MNRLSRRQWLGGAAAPWVAIPWEAPTLERPIVKTSQILRMPFVAKAD